ncbi:hypothetical protein R5R35_011634 [Gryllus longicercus]|uniref:Probable ATP-dependent RNA helicase spindle-E n=1 Tax=Gryllus longicercus TaxID=2509291 RepID=A0AAN9VZE1_9ORTH
MDLLDDFFNLNKKFERVVVPGSQTGGRIMVDPDSVPEDYRRHKVVSKGTDYVKEFREEDERLWREQGLEDENIEDRRKMKSTALHDVDDAMSLCSTMFTMDVTKDEELTRVYKVYDFSQRVASGLPIATFKDQIVHTIYTNAVTVIQGSTGCGKSTQVPQYILDHCRDLGEPCNIIVTQPRRLAAISVAKRVCYERNWTLGSLVGYQVGLNAKTCPDTRLTFCTTGVLLQKLVHSKSLGTYTHIILDEVHERNEDMDFSLMVIRRLMRRSYQGTKVILMSATMNPAKFSEYFSFASSKNSDSTPILDLDQPNQKRSGFRVFMYHLNELHKLGPLPEIKIDEPGISPKTYEIAFKLISQFDNLERSSEVFVKGAVLVFLPGIQEIEELFNLLATKSSQNKWWVRPLHSTITTDEQESVFSRPPSGYRKIILSTNIAESSLTVPDIVYVIDFCLTKHLICDPATNFSSLQVAWASKTSCIQRAGRAGRVQEGRVYRLVPATFYNECLADDQIPEILRCPLDRVILQTKLLDMGSPKGLLALCLDPPDLSNIENTILLLKEAGALLPTVNGLYKRDDGDLTFLGTVMAKLPVDIHVAKLIMLGHVFNVLEECIIIGAALSLKSMFSSPFQERMAAYDSKLMWADSSCSDSIAFLNAFNVWRSSKERGMFGPNGQKEESWARRYYLQLRALRETATLVRELRERLERMGITETKGYGRVSWSREESPLILKIVMAGAFYPHYFVRGSNGGQVDEKEAVRQLVGRDPFSTVFLQSLPMDQPGELYAKTIKRALGECGRNMKVSFDGTSKVYIQFGRPTTATAKTKTDFKFIPDIPGKVCMPVYKAVKLRQLKIPIVLHLMPARNAMERARELNLQPAQDSPWRWERKKEDSSVMKPSLPSVNTHIISLSISYIIDPGHFWAQSLEPDAIETLSEISRKLNTVDELLPVRAPKIGKIYAAPFTEHGSTYYYRARVNSIRPPKVQVLFIDYGNSSEVDIIDLREIRDATDPSTNAPPQAFECVLSELRPSLINNPRGGWSDTAKQDFSSKVGNYLFYGKIYSVVHGIVSLELIRQLPLNVKNKKGEEIKSINEYLIDKGYAEPAEESYLSRVNHDVRAQFSSNLHFEPCDRDMYDQLQEEYNDNWEVQQADPEPPHPSECNTTVILKGPFSPLEMKVYNITQVGLSRVVQIEWNSVNSVLLDTDPQDPHERLLVAACVGENPDHDRLTVRNTTLMPNIHGLSSLIYLVFAPTIELRRSPDGSTYTGALCGLGADPQTGVSYFPDHDMEVTFDTVITLEDIKNINRLRYWMTISFYTDADQEYPSCATSDMIQCQGKVKEFLFKLLNVPRPSQEVQLFHRPFKWNQVRKDLLLNPLGGGAVHENARAVFRLHWAVYLESKVDTSLVENVKFLHEVAEGKVTYSGDIDCKLCNIAFANARLLRIHLLSSHHVEKEKELVSR